MSARPLLAVADLPAWADRLLWAGVTVALALVVARLLRRLIRRWASEGAEETADLVRLKRQETAAAVLVAASRYVIVLVAAFALVGIFANSPVAALGGASLVVVLVAFALQRFLMDVVAGTLALVERQYAVGDFIAVDPMGLAGIVEELSLRTTVLRGLNGDRYIVPNSQISAVRRSDRGYRNYDLELLTHGPDEVETAVGAIQTLAPSDEVRFLRAPRVVERRELDEGLWLVRVQCAVAPTLEWLAEEYLVELLAKRLGDVLVAEPVVYTLDRAALRRYQARVLVR